MVERTAIIEEASPVQFWCKMATHLKKPEHLTAYIIAACGMKYLELWNLIPSITIGG